MPIRQLQASELAPTNMAANAPAHCDESGARQQGCLQVWQLKPTNTSDKAKKMNTNMAGNAPDDNSLLKWPRHHKCRRTIATPVAPEQCNPSFPYTERCSQTQHLLPIMSTRANFAHSDKKTEGRRGYVLLPNSLSHDTSCYSIMCIGLQDVKGDIKATQCSHLVQSDSQTQHCSDLWL